MVSKSQNEDRSDEAKPATDTKEMSATQNNIGRLAEENEALRRENKHLIVLLSQSEATADFWRNRYLDLVAAKHLPGGLNIRTVKKNSSQKE